MEGLVEFFPQCFVAFCIFPEGIYHVISLVQMPQGVIDGLVVDPMGLE